VLLLLTTPITLGSKHVEEELLMLLLAKLPTTGVTLGIKLILD